jgi:uncharacterized protein YkwD
MLNQERAKAGVVALRMDAQLVKIANAHTNDMLAHGFVGHTSQTTGTASDRVTAAGIRTGLVLENIGRGYSLSEVHAGLMQSPGHRSNLLHAQATDVGIAVAIREESGHPVYLVTQLFIRITPKLSAGAPGELFQSINRVRSARGLQPLAADVKLNSAAEPAARSCFAAGTRSDAPALEMIRARLAKLGTSTEHVAALLSLASSLSDLAELDALQDPKLHSIGIALSQGERSDTPPNTLCAVLVLSQ